MSLEQLTTRLFELEARYRLRPTSSLEPTWPIRDKYAIARGRSRSPFSAPHSPFPQPAKFRSPSPSRRLPPDFWQASREYSPYSAQLSSRVAHGSSGHVSAWAAGPPRGLAGSFPSSFSRPVQHPHLVHESAGYAKSNQYHPIMIHVNEPVTRPEPATILLARSRSQSRSQSGRSSPLAHELMYGIMHGRDPSAAVSEAPSDATFLANARGHTESNKWLSYMPSASARINAGAPRGPAGYLGWMGPDMHQAFSVARSRSHSRTSSPRDRGREKYAPEGYGTGGHTARPRSRSRSKSKARSESARSVSQHTSQSRRRSKSSKAPSSSSSASSSSASSRSASISSGGGGGGGADDAERETTCPPAAAGASGIKDGACSRGGRALSRSVASRSVARPQELPARHRSEPPLSAHTQREKMIALKLKVSVDYIRELQQLLMLERRLHKAQTAALGRPSVSPPPAVPRTSQSVPPQTGSPTTQTSANLPEPMAFVGKLLLEETRGSI